MTARQVVLVIDDNRDVQETIRENLEDSGYDVVTAASGVEMESSLKARKADIILLDLVLPDGNGLNLISRIRAATDVPIIIISGKGALVDKVVGLEMGADDYMSKPIEPHELTARVRAGLRRYNTMRSGGGGITADFPAKGPLQIQFGSWILDRMKFQALDERKVPANLTTKEYRLLEALVLSPQRVLSRDQLLDRARDGEFDVFDRTIDIQIARIRKKIGDNARDPRIIKTVRGAGYMLAVQTKIVE